jgi:hypothetical protein
VCSLITYCSHVRLPVKILCYDEWIEGVSVCGLITYCSHVRLPVKILCYDEWIEGVSVCGLITYCSHVRLPVKILCYDEWIEGVSRFSPHNPLYKFTNPYTFKSFTNLTLFKLQCRT